MLAWTTCMCVCVSVFTVDVVISCMDIWPLFQYYLSSSAIFIRTVHTMAEYAYNQLPIYSIKKHVVHLHMIHMNAHFKKPLQKFPIPLSHSSFYQSAYTLLFSIFFRPAEHKFDDTNLFSMNFCVFVRAHTMCSKYRLEKHYTR